MLNVCKISLLSSVKYLLIYNALHTETEVVDKGSYLEKKLGKHKFNFQNCRNKVTKTFYSFVDDKNRT